MEELRLGGVEVGVVCRVRRVGGGGGQGGGGKVGELEAATDDEERAGSKSRETRSGLDSYSLRRWARSPPWISPQWASSHKQGGGQHASAPSDGGPQKPLSRQCCGEKLIDGRYRRIAHIWLASGLSMLQLDTLRRVRMSRMTVWAESTCGDGDVEVHLQGGHRRPHQERQTA